MKPATLFSMLLGVAGKDFINYVDDVYKSVPKDSEESIHNKMVKAEEKRKRKAANRIKNKL